MKIVPTNTCRPCNPVEAKNTVPKTESAIENGAFKYSNPCRAVNIIANIIVYTKPLRAPLLLPCINEWWLYVTVTPEDNNITVLRRGNSNGFTGSNPIGGHWAPSSMAGVNELWKKDQNIAIKNKASDTINKITPKFKPFCTARVWLPKKVKN